MAASDYFDNLKNNKNRIGFKVMKVLKKHKRQEKEENNCTCILGPLLDILYTNDFPDLAPAHWPLL